MGEYHRRRTLETGQPKKVTSATGTWRRVYSSAVERLTADQQVPGSNPGAPFFIYQSTSALPGRQWGLLIKCLIRLAVRTPRCGRGNPGSIPGLDIYLNV